MFVILTAQAESLIKIDGLFEMICCMASFFGTALMIIGAFAFILGIYNEDAMSKASAITRMVSGTALIGLSLIARKLSNFLFTTSETTLDEAATIAETTENIAEQVSESGNSPFIYLTLLIPIILFIGIPILKCCFETDEISVEESEKYKNVDEVNQNTDTQFNESTGILLKNIHNLNELIRCSTGEIREKLQHISDAVKFLDEHDVDTRKLHSYYIPELLSIFEQSREIEETTQFGSVLETKQAHVKELQTNAVRTVTDIVNDLLRNCMDEKIDKLQCDTEVMETVSRQDGYKQDFGFQTYS